MPSSSTASQLQRWRDSGCAQLTGFRDGPALPPPPGLISALDILAARIHAGSKAVGDAVVVDPLGEVALRATTHGVRRQGRTNCGGSAQLLRCADGWLAVNLPRSTDLELVPALVEANVDWPWQAVAQWCAATPAAEAVSPRGVLLGLPIAALGEASVIPAVVETNRGTSTRFARKVLDLSSLWAGPLCGAVLARAGFEVTKLESIARPDGVHAGPAAFDEVINSGKRLARFDPRSPGGRAMLREAVESADVVIEGSRPRALQQMGIDRDDLDRGPHVWVSITGYGRGGDAGQRVGFGDDTAAAGGLVVWNDNEPLFCADAIADPITGMLAAASVLEAMATNDPQHLDIAMAAAAAWSAHR